VTKNLTSNTCNNVPIDQKLEETSNENYYSEFIHRTSNPILQVNDEFDPPIQPEIVTHVSLDKRSPTDHCDTNISGPITQWTVCNECGGVALKSDGDK
jgi:hypothetical protein